MEIRFVFLKRPNKSYKVCYFLLNLCFLSVVHVKKKRNSFICHYVAIRCVCELEPCWVVASCREIETLWNKTLSLSHFLVGWGTRGRYNIREISSKLSRWLECVRVCVSMCVRACTEANNRKRYTSCLLSFASPRRRQAALDGWTEGKER